ncbi:hypothetical protein TD95_001889 [Thielaviopsis punctulata]|uniref:Uncharacterized protein n=1 Tax=Thielaviopsis punctulata TaxID=72032 RepID=A0A0F4ZEN7_9PEZI|nr:hypothetical protein TD95_001889 [Thielaviopsis punctulata]
MVTLRSASRRVQAVAADSPAKSGDKASTKSDSAPTTTTAAANSSQIDTPADNLDTARAKNVKTFDSDDEGEPIVQAPEPVTPAQPQADSAHEESDDDDDDDDAPEVVSTSAAAGVAKESAKAAQKAIQEAAAAEKQKRKARDARLKQQAAERKAKEAAIDAEIAALSSSTPRHGAADSRAARRKMKSAVALPAELPASFLDSDSGSDSEEEHGGLLAAAINASNKKRKPAAVEDPDADRVVGQTTFRVVKKVKTDMAPVAQKRSVSMKAHLLGRNRGPAVKKKGFGRR